MPVTRRSARTHSPSQPLKARSTREDTPGMGELRNWPIKSILDEDSTGQWFWLEWEGADPNTGEPWPPTWTHRARLIGCTQLLREWEDEKRAARETAESVQRSPTPAPVADNKASSEASDEVELSKTPVETEPIHNTVTSENSASHPPSVSQDSPTANPKCESPSTNILDQLQAVADLWKIYFPNVEWDDALMTWTGREIHRRPHALPPASLLPTSLAELALNPRPAFNLILLAIAHGSTPTGQAAQHAYAALMTRIAFCDKREPVLRSVGDGLRALHGALSESTVVNWAL